MGTSKQYRRFEDARDFARGLNLNGYMEWVEFCAGRLPDKGTRPPDIPSTPNKRYAGKGWNGYGDWLGTGNIANFRRQFRPFPEAREFAPDLKLNTQAEWMLFCQGKVRGKGPRD